MRIRSIMLATLAAAALLPAAAGAQVYESIVVQRAGSGMLGLATETVRIGGQPAGQRIVREVVPGSAAAQAGVAVGDTIVRINGLAASEQVMFAPLSPGDTVRLRIRRGGQERDITVVAGVRPQQGGMSFLYPFPDMPHALPDSIQRQMSIIMRGVQENLDTIVRRGVFIERSPGDGNMVFRFGPDSVRVFSYDSRAAAMLQDSVAARFRELTGDVRRLMADSARLRMFGDSAGFVFRGPGNVERRFSADTIRFLNPGEAVLGGMALGYRAVAGAELSELNPGLAEYFGVQNGVLVLNAREGTPAANAGIRAGDVIVRANGVNITSVAELRRAMMSASPRSPVEVRVLRHGQHVELRIGG
jgi:membrane-associated protease RseP (regulator of RpoE activity)